MGGLHAWREIALQMALINGRSALLHGLSTQLVRGHTAAAMARYYISTPNTHKHTTCPFESGEEYEYHPLHELVMPVRIRGGIQIHNDPRW